MKNLKDALKRILKIKEKSRGEFSEMDKKEKQNFLSNDLIERLIRVEQRVGASFGKYVPYQKSDYYKSLTSEEKKRFERYLKLNSRTKALLTLLILLPVFIFGLFRLEGTGRVIDESLSLIQFPLWVWKVLFLVLGLLLILLLFRLIGKIRRRMRLKNHFKIIEKVSFRNKKK